MNITHIFSLLGGLGLFLYGMRMLSSNLEAAAGDRMKAILEKLASNPVRGVLVGAGITAVVQSSSAITVMVVGFVNSGIMTLKQAVWIIMGANVGTTVTGQLTALDAGAVAPLFAFIGLMMLLFSKNKRLQLLGGTAAGLGVMFIGLRMMSDSMLPLRDSREFISLMTRFSHPLMGILAGTVFTAVIQSSSVSVGILQALARNGIIGLDGAVYVIFGQNIGTCLTAILASIGTNCNAKRTTLIHLLINLIGTAIFLVICRVIPFVSIMEQWTPGHPAAQIANVHTVFNVVTTVILLPFGGCLVKLSRRLLPDKNC